MSYQVEHRPLEVSEYQTLRKTTNWPPLEDSAAEKALQRDLLSVCITYDQRPVGIGRVIGDGAIYFYIQDVMVDPQHQGKGSRCPDYGCHRGLLKGQCLKKCFCWLNGR